MPRLYAPSGSVLDATFSVAREHDVVVIYFESRGGDRNTQYAPALELLLLRLGQLDAILADAFVASADTAHLTPDQRRIHISGYPFPVHLKTLPDVGAFRIAMGRAVAAIGRRPGSSGSGNATKRLRLLLDGLERVRDLKLLMHRLQHSQVIQYWALQANPKTYRIGEAVRSLETDLWTTRGKSIRVGDRALIWQARGPDGRRGIVALGEVIGEPRQASDFDNPFWVEPAAAAAIDERVRVRYLTPPGLPLWLDAPGNDFLNELSVSRGQGTVFRVSPDQWQRVLNAAGGWDDRWWGTVESSFGDSPVRRERGQGRGLGPLERKVVEEYAMKRAMQYFESRGFGCRDVSATASYDLHCSCEGEELYVEVKGTTTLGESILLSFNEVELARERYPNTALVVTSEIVLDRQNTPPVARGGRTRLIQPWRPSSATLKSITYECTLGSEYGTEVVAVDGDEP